MEEVIREQEPERWARHVRKHVGDESHEGAGAGSGPAASEDPIGRADPPGEDDGGRELFGDESDEDGERSAPAMSDDEGEPPVSHSVGCVAGAGQGPVARPIGEADHSARGETGAGFGPVSYLTGGVKGSLEVDRHAPHD